MAALFVRGTIAKAFGLDAATRHSVMYLTGSIHLQSNTALHLDAGAVPKFSQDFDDYLPMVKSRWKGTDCRRHSEVTTRIP